MWYTTSFTNLSANEALNARVQICKRGEQSEMAEETLKSYCAEIHYLLITNEKVDDIEEADTEFRKYPSSKKKRL